MKIIKHCKGKSHSWFFEFRGLIRWEHFMLLGHHCHHYYADCIQKPQWQIVLNWKTQLGKAKWLLPAESRAEMDPLLWTPRKGLLSSCHQMGSLWMQPQAAREINSKRSSHKSFKFWGSVLFQCYNQHSRFIIIFFIKSVYELEMTLCCMKKIWI